MDVYIIENSKALTLRDADNIQTILNEALTKSYDQRIRTTRIDITKLDANDVDCKTSYKDTPIPVHLHTLTSIIQTKLHNIKWNPKTSYTRTAHK